MDLVKDRGNVKIFELNTGHEGSKSLFKRELIDPNGINGMDSFVIWSRWIEHSERPSMWKSYGNTHYQNPNRYIKDGLERRYQEIFGEDKEVMEKV